MKRNKAINWQKISEGVITANEIENLENKKQAISLILLSVTPTGNAGIGTSTSDIQIVSVRGPAYNVINRLGGTASATNVNKKPYKYLSCAVRRAVKEYKQALRTGQWRILTK